MNFYPRRLCIKAIISTIATNMRRIKWVLFKVRVFFILGQVY